MDISTASIRRPLYSQLIYNYAELVYSRIRGKAFVEESFGSVNDMLDDTAKMARPHKETLLHDVIRTVGDLYNEDAAYDYPHYFVDEAREMLRAASMSVPRWLTVKVMEKQEPDYRARLYKRISRAFDEAIVPAVFYVLFSDKTFLGHFQERVAEQVRDLKRRNDSQRPPY